MAYINSHSNITTKTELDIFATPPTQNSVEGGTTFCYRPLSVLSGTAPIEFIVPSSGDEYIDLAHTTLHITVKVQADEVLPENTELEAGPVNNWLHSLFSQVDIHLNQKCITPPSNNYNYRAYIENLLNYTDNAKKSHLTAGMWHKDTPGNMNLAGNVGYETRKKIIKKGFVEMYGNLHCDIFNQDKFMVNGIEMGVKLIKSKNEFHLMGKHRAIAEIVDAELYVRKVKINPSILVAHARALSVTTAKYPITRVEIKTITIGTGIQSKSIDNLFLGQMPKRCIIGMVKSPAFNGDFNLNPFNFEHFDFNYLCLYLDSVQIPSKPLTPDFANNQYTRTYYSLFEGSGIYFADTGNTISLDEYPHGYCLQAFDLTPDLSCNDPHWNLIKSGALRAEIRFNKPLFQAVTLIVFAEFDNVIEIDKHRNIILDYSS